MERLKLPGGAWLESSAGEGGIIKAVNAVRSDVDWTACELREECRMLLLESGVAEDSLLTGRDFLTLQTPREAVVSINNPPFSLAMEFIEKTLPCATFVIHLLRLNFLGTSQRNVFFRANMPDIYVVPDRISFTGDGKADSIEYAWFVFGPERCRRTGKIEVLDHTPLEQRR